MADALDSKSCVLTGVWVRLPPLVLFCGYISADTFLRRWVISCLIRGIVTTDTVDIFARTTPDIQSIFAADFTLARRYPIKRRLAC